jgi:hypothetical protein
LLVEPLGRARRLILLAAVATLAICAAPAVVARARAAETIYWENTEPASLAFAEVDGRDGGALNLSGAPELKFPEGQAYDPVNARLYVVDAELGKIIWVNIGRPGAGVLDIGAAPFKSPAGIVIDPGTQIIYWANNETAGSIGWAHLDGSGGGEVLLGGLVRLPYRISIDTTAQRLYWYSEQEETFESVDVGGGLVTRMEITGATPPETPTSIAVDPAAGRLYWLDDGLKKLLWVNLSGVGGGEVDIAGANFNEPLGLAFDPSIGRFYWGNAGNVGKRLEAIGTATLAPGGGGGISPVTAPVSEPGDPVVVRSPSLVTAPELVRSGSLLSCSQGTWSQDYPGSSVYAAPTRFSYQWTVGGQAIPGATATSLTATAAGAYRCEVTASNRSGSASAGTGIASVTAPDLSMSLPSKKLVGFPGKTVTVRFTLANSGDLSSTPVQVCAAKLSKQASKGLVAPPCVAVAPLAPGGSAVASLLVKIKKGAGGLYKFTAEVKGAEVEPVAVAIKVPSKPHPKHHEKKHHMKRHHKK